MMCILILPHGCEAAFVGDSSSLTKVSENHKSPFPDGSLDSVCDSKIKHVSTQ